MRRALAFVVVLFAGGGVQGQPGEKPGANPFATDPRFAAPLTLSVKETHLSDLLAALRRDHSLPVRADRTTQDERITLFCRARPAGEILGAVARHLDYTWVRKIDATREEYVLLQTAEQRRREEQARVVDLSGEKALLQAAIASCLEAARKPAGERPRPRVVTVDPATGLTPDGERVEGSVPRQLTVTQRVLRPDGKIEEKEVPASPVHVLLNAPTPDRDALGAALLAMGPAHWERLWAGQPFRFAYPGGGSRTRLSAQQAVAMVRTQTEGQSESEPDAEGYIRFGRFLGVDGVRGEVSLSADENSVSLRLRCRFAARQDHFPEGRDLSIRTSLQGVDQRGPAWYRQPQFDEADQEFQRPLEFPPAAPRSRNQRYGIVADADLVEALAAQVPFSVIADSYEPAGGRQAAPAGRMRVAALLRGWLRGMRATRAGDTLFLRHFEWSRLRPLQVPDRVTRPWEALLPKRSGLPLRTLVDIKRGLSDERIDLVLGRWERRGLMSGGEHELLRWNLVDEGDGLALLSRLSAADLGVLLRPGSPRVPLRRRDQREWVVRWLTGPENDRADDPGGMMEPQFPPRSPGSFWFDEERLETGAAAPSLRVVRDPYSYYLGPSSFPRYSDTLQEALQEELQLSGRATAADMQQVKGSLWGVHLFSDMSDRHHLASFWLMTPDSR